MNKCSSRIRAVMDEQGLTYERVEEMTGTAKSSIQRYVSGETDKIPVSFVERFAEATSSHVTYLLGLVDEEETATIFTKRLNQAMQIRNISQVELCTATGIPKSAMSQYCSGAFTPKQERTHLIAKALNVNEDWLLGYDDAPMDRNEEKPIRKKLIIEVDNGNRDSGYIVRISERANALLEDCAKRSNRSKSYIASKMIEYAYNFVEYLGEDT